MFEGAFDVKRVSPGEVIGGKDDLLFHDCTTLEGN